MACSALPVVSVWLKVSFSRVSCLAKGTGRASKSQSRTLRANLVVLRGSGILHFLASVRGAVLCLCDGYTNVVSVDRAVHDDGD